MKQFFSLCTLMCAMIAAQAQDVYNEYCTQGITLQSEGGELGTNAEWKWYTGSCGGTLVYTGASYTINPTASATYYVRAEGSCGTTTCRSVIVNVLPPTLTVRTNAAQAVEGYNITFTGTGFPEGGVYTWSAATSIGGNAATATISSASTNGVVSAADNRPLLRATATYSVGGGVAGCSSTATDYTILAAATACPYTGNDLVTGSCYQASDGARNWRATIDDARVSGTATLHPTEGRKYYNIVRMPDNKWWFAENLNFQKGLTWESRVDSVDGGSTTMFNGVGGIGNFWCPGLSGTKVNNRVACDAWGALYTWEAAMMVDGRYSDESKTDENWAEPTALYCNIAYDATACTQTTGKGDGNRGICHSGLYVPTLAEWAIMMNNVETGEKNIGYTEVACGTYAGMLLKKNATIPNQPVSTSKDDLAAWYDPDPNAGKDVWGFAAIPAGTSWTNSQYSTYQYHRGGRVH